MAVTTHEYASGTIPVVEEPVAGLIRIEFEERPNLVLQAWERLEREQPELVRSMAEVINGAPRRSEAQKAEMMRVFTMTVMMLETQAEADQEHI